MKREAGFTLIEVLLAMALFALITAVAYGALAIGGDGFQQLQAERDRLESEQWLARQLRQDISGVTHSQNRAWSPVALTSDPRGENHFDQLTILVQEPGQVGLTWVRYAIDEEAMQLVRESVPALARSGFEPIAWNFANIQSLDVALLNKQGEWLERWDEQSGMARDQLVAVRVRVGDAKHTREWNIPIAY
ncbi:MAG: type II secretion system protein [Zetaproteobacteria bacterium]|nr:type II secretion system protein [Zetaproteobacteria bacterium]